MPNTNHQPTLRVLHILGVLAENPDGLTLTELANSIVSPKSTILPILNTMRKEGFLSYSSNSTKYKIGIKAYTVGASYISNMSALQFIRARMKYVVRESDEICQLGILDHNQVFYVAIEETNAPIRLASYVGKRLPVYCTGLGKALCCNKSIQELREMFPNGLAPITARTITDFDTLALELEEVRRTHIAREEGEVLEGLTCVSVPLYNKDVIVAAVSVSFPISRSTDEKIRQVTALLLDLQQKVRIYLETNDATIETFTFGMH